MDEQDKINYYKLERKIDSILELLKGNELDASDTGLSGTSVFKLTVTNGTGPTFADHTVTVNVVSQSDMFIRKPLLRKWKFF